MLPTEDLFVYVYVLVDDAIGSGAVAIAARPGRAPACSDAELLTIALVRHLLGGAARPGSWPRWRGTGRTCTRGCRIKARPTGGSAGCGAPSSRYGRCWRPGCPAVEAFIAQQVSLTAAGTMDQARTTRGCPGRS